MKTSDFVQARARNFQFNTCKSFLVWSPNYRFCTPQNISFSELGTTDFVSMQFSRINSSGQPILCACIYSFARDPNNRIVRLHIFSSQSNKQSVFLRLIILPSQCFEHQFQYACKFILIGTPYNLICTTLYPSLSEHRTNDFVRLQILASPILYASKLFIVRAPKYWFCTPEITSYTEPTYDELFTPLKFFLVGAPRDWFCTLANHYSSEHRKPITYATTFFSLLNFSRSVLWATQSLRL
jgi:hypothetical protein